jgi:hypothetical protein
MLTRFKTRINNNKQSNCDQIYNNNFKKNDDDDDDDDDESYNDEGDDVVEGDDDDDDDDDEGEGDDDDDENYDECEDYDTQIMLSLKKKILNKVKNHDINLYNDMMNIEKYINDKSPNIIEILQTPMKLKNKAELIELYEIYQCSPIMTEETMILKHRLVTLYKKYKLEYTVYTNTVTPAIESKIKLEQIKIKKEVNNLPLKYKILMLNTDTRNKKIIYERYNELKILDPSDDNYPKLSKWLNCVVSLPYDNILPNPVKLKKNINNYLYKIKQALDKELYGMVKVKEQLLLFINSKLTNPSITGCCLGLLGTAGCGKCLSKDTPIIMYNGTIKMVQDITVGEQIMGDNSTPRNVLSTCTGIETMYNIKQDYGDNYTVNESHIISLMLDVNPVIIDVPEEKKWVLHWYSKEKYNSITYSYQETTKQVVFTRANYYTRSLPQKGSVIDIELLEYLKRPIEWKHVYKGFKVGVEFKQITHDIDPYFLGIWLGAGCKHTSNVIVYNTELIDYVNNYTLTFQENVLGDMLKKYNLYDYKHIPNNYKTNSSEIRLKLLAGLIDSNGTLKNNNSLSINSMCRILATDILYLTRSLGYCSTLTEVLGERVYGGEKIVITYYHVLFNGYLDKIPLLLPFKVKKTLVSNTLVSNITIEKLNVDNYYGFTIDDNHRFLLGDFTVTHNTAISRALSKVMSIPFSQISFGGITNPDYIKGHDYTYVGSQAGEITRSLCEMNYKNGILFFDEYEKVSDNKSITSLLLHITDPVQNHEFKDAYLSGITQDLSNLWFIYSMNNLPLDPALRDRIHIINVPDYNIEDKVNILNDFFLPKAIGMVGLSSHSVIIPVDVAKYIINKMKVQEKGVRQLQFVVIDLVKKINFLVTNKKKDGTLGFLNVSFYIKNINLPLTLTSNMVDTLFNDSNIDNTSHLLMYN